MADAKMIFPPDFRWGTATSSHQVEGNNKNSDWWAWEQENGRILHNHRSALACNWWQNGEADFDIAAEMGTNAHRLSLEWSRIEPEPSVFDEDAIDRYRQLLQALHDRNIEPMVTLHHFSNPLWLNEKGDFNNGIVVDYFQRYTAKVVARLGDLIPKWVTINEPIVYMFMRYLDGKFPTPQKEGWGAGFTALHNLLHCHAVAYHAIKAVYPQAEVGISKSIQTFAPRIGGNMIDAWWAKRIGWLFNDMWLESLINGRLRWPLGRRHIPRLAGALDFIGVNYYTRFYLKFPPPRGIIERDWGTNAVVSDGDYGEIYPAGLFQAIQRTTRFKKPIYITENGVPDRADKLRPSFLISHLREVWRALNFCYPVMGYYHWSLIDNFEWDRGWSQRFGLIGLDTETQMRTWRPSAHLYQQICQQGGLSSEMTKAYAPALMPVLFPGQAPVS